MDEAVESPNGDHSAVGRTHRGSERSKPRKARRISRACDFCHRRSIRCRISQEDGSRCQNCVDFEQGCTFDRPSRRRGVKSGQSAAPTRTLDAARDSSLPLEEIRAYELGRGGPNSYLPLSGFKDNGESPTSSRSPWQAHVVANQSIIMNLVDVYFDVIFPIFPFFHRPTLVYQVSSGRHLTDQAFFAAVMAVCALASARARDGALFAEKCHPASVGTGPPSETFCQAAKDAIPKDLTVARGIDYMRACALLSIVSIQYGQVRAMHHYLGLYHTLVAMDGLHDEANWPEGTGIVETEERRRLFWSTYTLDVFSSIIWGGIIRCREAQSSVLYPSEIDDDDFNDSGFSSSVSPSSVKAAQYPNSLLPSNKSVSWLRGWNFTTDLYRILEHALNHFDRRRPRSRPTSAVRDIFKENALSQASVLDNVVDLYAGLPQRFRETPPVISDPVEDRLNFQAANIAATLLLVRMVLFTVEGATIEERCHIASELLDGLSKVPVAYLRAISSPLLHHLAGIGSILGSVFEKPLSESSYFRVRTVLLAMADLLANLEIGLHTTTGASERLKSHVTRIDEYMQKQRHSSLVSHQQSIHASPNGDRGTYQAQRMVETMLDQIQLPPELIEVWPWEFDFAPPASYS